MEGSPSAGVRARPAVMRSSIPFAVLDRFSVPGQGRAVPKTRPVNFQNVGSYLGQGGYARRWRLPAMT
jgi:hypothetical protein